ncbi:hypothetical protein ACFVVC_01685 [Pseudarthrobacter sp. NPDC058196]|uniref:hypothetical protein n=1 Tax=Pseudarthrobacter sp. NPDC058196 TaxID=3346376 RepID=UPI0036DABD74
MTENYPPVPPAPQQQPAGFQPPSPQPYQGNQAPQYGQPPAPAPYGQQPYPQQQPYGQQPQYAPYPPQQYAPQWAPPSAKPKSSGFRVAAGIVGIVLGFFTLIEAGPGFGHNAFIALLLLIAALGNITSGILLLVTQRGRTRGAPITAISFAGFALLASLMAIAVPYYGGAPFIIDVLLATPVIVVMSLGLSRETRGA